MLFRKMYTIWIDEKISDGKKRGKNVGEQVAKHPWTIVVIRKGGKYSAIDNARDGDARSEDIL